MTDYTAIHRKLASKRNELMDRINKSQQEEREEVQSDGNRDNAHLWEESDIRDSLNEQAREELAQVNAALARIENGTFGRCTICGESISVNRLEAVPYATACLDCG